MTPGQPSEDVCACASRLVNLIQVLALNEPHILHAVEANAWSVVAEARRDDLRAQLTQLTAEQLGRVGQFIAQLRTPPAA
ncbi:MAG TPA: hypothetical protein VKD28_04725 [Gemmatimonadales bacterium]|nr:hypothetical protein [Gemmatimonadales bacterium]